MKLIKKILILSLMFTFFISCGQENKSKGKIIENKENKSNIPGTKVLINIPVDFKIASDFIGLIKNDYTVIQIMEINDSFSNQSTNFKPSEFTNKGGEIIENYDLKVSKYPAKYMSVKSPDNRKLHLLLFGDADFCIMASGILSLSDNETDELIKKTIFDMKYDKSIKIDYLKVAGFKLLNENKKYKFASATAGQYNFTKNGKDIKRDDDSPSLIVNTAPKDNSFSLQDTFDFIIQMQEKYGLTDRVIKNKSVNFINGNVGLVAEIYGKIDNENYLIYVQLIESNNSTITIIGKSKIDNKTDLKDFKEFANNITFK